MTAVENGQSEVAPAEVRIVPPNPARALPWLAALSVAGMPYRVERGPDDWEIWVPAECAEAARRELAEYERVNRGWPPFIKPAAAAAGSDMALAASLAATALLVLFYRYTGPVAAGTRLFDTAAAQAGKILDGEWWRTLTALMLHADFGHLLGNVTCCLLFGTAVCLEAGPGFGWCLILLTGILGNLATAAVGDASHVAIGASTATFGALGLLSVFQLAHNVRRYGSWRSIWNRTWIPLAAGTAMLAMLGVGPRADRAAHLFGFVFGCGLAAVMQALPRRRPGPRLQTLLAVGCGLLVYFAWQRALAG